MFSKKSSTTDKGKEKPKDPQDLSVRLDTLEMESVNEQLKEIEAKKARDKKSS